MKLTEHQQRDESWLLLKADYEQRLIDLRRQNDRQDLTEIQTAVLRGRIAEVKRNLAVADPEPDLERD